MTTTSFLTALLAAGSAKVRFMLPDGGLIPAHAHVTEVGRVDKRFIDCGGTQRADSHCLLQTWVADDVDHQLHADKLARILQLGAPLLGEDELPVYIEYEEGLVSQFPVVDAVQEHDSLYFRTSMRHTDCLAKEVCIPGSGCCA
jgi:hypothetical protein